MLLCRLGNGNESVHLCRSPGGLAPSIANRHMFRASLLSVLRCVDVSLCRLVDSGSLPRNAARPRGFDEQARRRVLSAPATDSAKNPRSWSRPNTYPAELGPRPPSSNHGQERPLLVTAWHFPGQIRCVIARPRSGQESPPLVTAPTSPRRETGPQLRRLRSTSKNLHRSWLRLRITTALSHVPELRPLWITSKTSTALGHVRNRVAFRERREQSVALLSSTIPHGRA